MSLGIRHILRQHTKDIWYSEDESRDMLLKQPCQGDVLTQFLPKRTEISRYADAKKTTCQKCLAFYREVNRFNLWWREHAKLFD